LYGRNATGGLVSYISKRPTAIWTGNAIAQYASFRLALGKLPGSGAGLASQSTMSRWENAPTTRELARMMAEMIGVYCASYPASGGHVREPACGLHSASSMRCYATMPNTWTHPTGAHRCTKALAPRGSSTPSPQTEKAIACFARSTRTAA